MSGAQNGSEWPTLNDSDRGGMHAHNDPLSTNDVIYILIIISNVLAIIINSFVIIVTVSMASLRKCVSSYLVIILCVFDILASCASLPKFIKILTDGCLRPSEDNTYCIVYEFLNGFFTYSICACILAINVDKYHSITFPMHYSSHVTKVSVLITQGAILFTSAVFSSTPLYVTNGSHERSCGYVYSHGLVNVSFACVTVTVYFVIPCLCMAIMNLSVYRVAKRSLAQISASSTITYEAFYKQNDALRKSKSCQDNSEKTSAISVIAFKSTDINNTSFRSLSLQEPVNGNCVNVFGSNCKNNGCLNNANCTNAFCCDHSKLKNWKSYPKLIPSSNPCDNHTREIQCATIESSKFAPGEIGVVRNGPANNEKEMDGKKSQLVLKTNYKAVKNLVIPYIYFIIIWGSYFTVYLDYARRKYMDPEAASDYFTVVGIMVYISFALNPVIYVLMRKNFKEETVEFFRSCRRKQQNISVLELTMNQTFQQFLESSA